VSSVLERLTDACNAHDADRVASYFAEDYVSAQPAHPQRAFTGRAQVLTNWTGVFDGVPDFRGELRACSVSGDTEWAELDWRGRHVDGSTFAMRGVIIATVRDGLIAEARLYMEPVEDDGDGIDAAVAELYRAPSPD
jgi:ketosteroid isomerase-like protein